MAWIMKLVTSSGNRYCNQVCWNAKGDNCKCICGGKNHKIGLDKVKENLKKSWDEFVGANKGELLKREVDKDGKPIKV